MGVPFRSVFLITDKYFELKNILLVFKNSIMGNNSGAGLFFGYFRGEGESGSNAYRIPEIFNGYNRLFPDFGA